MEDPVPREEPETEVRINIHYSGHMGAVLSSLEEQRKKNFLCDITLVVENVEFRAHKALLAASSEYFSMMFADEGSIGQSVYVIEGIVGEVFEALLKFIYTGTVHVSEKFLRQIVATAQVLKVDNLVKAYIDYQQDLLSRADEISDKGADEISDKGAEEISDKGADEIFDKGAEEVSDKEADEVSDKGAEEISDKGATDVTEDHALSKRKRGRPKKCDQGTTQADSKETDDHGASLQSMEITCYSNGSILHDHEVADFAAEVTCDLNPKPQEEQIILNRHSKRRSRRSTKLQGYRIGEDNEGRKPTKHSGGKKKQQTIEPCKDCGKVFKYKHFLATHRRIHTGERPFKCAECGQGFTQKNSLRAHERIHTGERPYSCTVCFKSLATKHSLLEHMRLHADAKAFTCEGCGKHFTQRRQLKSHYRVHIGEKPYTCEICGKSFTAKSSLHTHMIIHRGEKPYACNICGRSFADGSARRRHLSLHTKEKPFSCPNCSVQFTRLDNLKAHIKSHSKEKKRKPPSPTTSTRPKEEARKVVQMQEYEVANTNPQEMQLVVADNVHNLNLISGQGQGIVTAEAPPPVADQAANVTLLTHPPPVLHGLPVASPQQRVQPIQNIDLVSSRVQPIHNIDLVSSRVQPIHNIDFVSSRVQPIHNIDLVSSRVQPIHNIDLVSSRVQPIHNIDLVSSRVQPIHNIDLVSSRVQPIHSIDLVGSRVQPIHNIDLVGSRVQPIHNIDLVGSRVQTVLPEQMHVVTLSKEAFEQLQGRTREIHLAQTSRQPTFTQMQPRQAPTILNQAVRVPANAQHALTVGPVTQPVPGHPPQAQSFQIPAGAVSSINTALNTTNSTSV